MRFLSALCLVIVLMPFSVLAHGAGAYYETTIGNFIADVGFTSPAPEVNESVVFDFQLRGINTALIAGSDVAFTNVWVRIESENKTLLATGIYNAEFGGPRLSYVFPKEGEYTVFVRYENNSDALAEISFPMTVVPESGRGAGAEDMRHALFGGGGLVIGLLVAFALQKFFRFKQ